MRGHFCTEATEWWWHGLSSQPGLIKSVSSWALGLIAFCNCARGGVDTCKLGLMSHHELYLHIHFRACLNLCSWQRLWTQSNSHSLRALIQTPQRYRKEQQGIARNHTDVNSFLYFLHSLHCLWGGISPKTLQAFHHPPPKVRWRISSPDFFLFLTAWKPN